ncbi:MAG: ThuA domain-containing protein, partial [Saprospiraceae bacterium]|nr:ThuA domain-containing protein [Saprospiraceae bacterium]
MEDLHFLVFSKTEGFRHESIKDGLDMMGKLAEEHGFSFEATEDADIFIEHSLKAFDAIVFLNTTGDVLDDAQQMEMKR